MGYLDNHTQGHQQKNRLRGGKEETEKTEG